MACWGQCFWANPFGGGLLHNHDSLSPIATTMYRCPIHECYHAIWFSQPTVQPLCGSCAAISLCHTAQALWLPSLDIPTTLRHRAVRLKGAEGDIRNLAREAELVEGQSSSIDYMRLEYLVPLFVPEAFDTLPYQSEIAVEDITYIYMSDALIPDRHIPGMRLLRFVTFHGTQAFQPCHKDIEALGMFKALDHIERNGDPAFKAARIWSCTVQAIEDLPKAVR
ncbi:hypothetical protein CDV31_009514 [Fusarium ambrosium]|uniref:Uncharacterized protein n=1 Tax=Fusarium ambrosium TaxID=131363 RepID=A0A428TUB4_9HYPO|nr:hypothetical protein CDV31_009514 [Fusarium ambrosium]